MSNCLLFVTLIILMVYLSNQVEDSKTEKESPFYIVTEHRYLIVPISIGSPVKEMNLVIDINSAYSWVSSSLFNEKQSDSYKTLNETIDINQDAFSYHGVLSSDQFSMYNTKLSQFHFGLINEIKNNSNYLGVLSLSFSEKKTNLVNQLYSNNYIPMKSFSLKYITPYEGRISFGHTHDAINKERTVSKCTIKNKNKQTKWACKLNYISFGELQLDNKNRRVLNTKDNQNTIQVNQIASFETVYDRINIPNEYYNFIKEKIFHIDPQSDNVSTNKCYTQRSQEGVNQIKCPRGMHDTIPKITFFFNDQALATDPRTMFHCKNNICTYYIIHIEGNEEWRLGYHFLKHFNIYFNHNEKTIYFTSDNNNYSIYLPSNYVLIKQCGYLILILLFIGISFLAFVIFIKGKNINKKKHQAEFYKKFNNSKNNTKS